MCLLQVPKPIWAIACAGHALGIKPLYTLKRMIEPFNLKGTPLHHAALKGNLEVVAELVKLGADTQAKDKYGLTPLERAAEGIPGNPAGTGVAPLAGTPTLEVLKELLQPKKPKANFSDPNAPTDLFA